MAKIVIVDDSKFLRVTLSNILKKENHEIVGEGENGLQAIQLYKELRPDILTLDLTMPKMSGLEALREIKKEFPHAKVMICSALGKEKMVVDSIKSGAADFIVKPFDEERVLQAVQRLLD